MRGEYATEFRGKKEEDGYIVCSLYQHRPMHDLQVWLESYGCRETAQQSSNPDIKGEGLFTFSAHGTDHARAEMSTLGHEQ
jgi:hypothetical protein